MDEPRAGRELDACIATDVMGRVVVYPYRDTHDDWQDHPWYEVGPGVTPTGLAPVTHFSIDLVAAWQVIERLHALGFHARINTPFSEGAPYWVGFTEHNETGWNGIPDYLDSAETMPLATCRAAMAAVGAVETRSGGLAAGAPRE